jgi:hypothetical protein
VAFYEDSEPPLAVDKNGDYTPVREFLLANLLSAFLQPSRALLMEEFARGSIFT